MAEKISLFDGESLNGWGITRNPDGWTVEDGCIYCKAEKGGYLYTERNDFKDFEVSLAFKHHPKANSGVFFRWTDLEDPVQTGIEIQILDTHGRDPATVKCSGAVYDVQAPSHNSCKPAGEWNTLLLKAEGPVIDVTLNDDPITHADLSAWTTAEQNPDGTPNKFKRPYCEMVEAGHIGLQDHGGRIWFRDLEIRLL